MRITETTYLQIMEARSDVEKRSVRDGFITRKKFYRGFKDRLNQLVSAYILYHKVIILELNIEFVCFVLPQEWFQCTLLLVESDMRDRPT